MNNKNGKMRIWFILIVAIIIISLGVIIIKNNYNANKTDSLEETSDITKDSDNEKKNKFIEDWMDTADNGPEFLASYVYDLFTEQEKKT